MVDSQIKDALITLLSGITQADAGTIDREMGKIEALTAKNREALHPQLVHFLERRSYAKALAFLGGDVPSAGRCAPRS